MNRMPARSLIALWLLSTAAVGQAPIVEKVDPPNWWTRSTVNPVRVLIRGRHLAGARVECARLRCAGLKVNVAGTYAFVDVTIPVPGAPGKYPFTLRTPAGSASVPFEGSEASKVQAIFSRATLLRSIRFVPRTRS